jgi:ligand-binding sensor domain-containing protein
MRFIFLIYIILAFSFLQTYAQKGSWESFTTSNSNIPFNDIHAITVDKQGSVWCGTNINGSYSHLARYGGKSWTGHIYPYWVNGISVASNGYIWISTSGKSLQEWVGSFWITYNSELFNSQWAEPIHVDSAGNVWLAADTTILKFDGNKWTAYNQSIIGMSFDKITSIASIGKKIWFATQHNGLINFDGTNWKNLNDTTFIASLNVDALISIGDSLFMAFHNGTIEFFKDSTKFNAHFGSFPEGYASQITSDRYGNLWVATNHGVYIFSLYAVEDLIHYDKSNSPLPTNQITSIAADSTGNIWMGTTGYGLIKYSPPVVSVNDEQLFVTYLEVSPNPCSGECKIQYNLEQSDIINISIFDFMGRKLSIIDNCFREKGIHSVSFDCSDLPCGTYILYLQSGNLILTDKLIIMK